MAGSFSLPVASILAKMIPARDQGPPAAPEETSCLVQRKLHGTEQAALLKPRLRIRIVLLQIRDTRSRFY